MRLFPWCDTKAEGVRRAFQGASFRRRRFGQAAHARGADQMRRTSQILPFAFGIGAALAAAAAGWLLLRPVPPVTVIVKNNSGKVVASVRLEHEHGVETLENLGPGDARTIRFRAEGETSYRLRVQFVDGAELAGGGGYAEAGYEFSETISDSGITTDSRLPAWP